MNTMADTIGGEEMRSFYEKEEVLLIIPQLRGEEIRVMIGTRSNGTEYLDIRTWYTDDMGMKRPGKGFGKPDKENLSLAIALAILKKEELKQSGPKVYNPLNQLGYEKLPRVTIEDLK